MQVASKTAQPLVSVVVPFLNPGGFLDEAIQSVFAQSYTRWELLLVDDGSDDGSSDVARRWAAEHPERVRALEHEDHVNHGQSASRNLGIRHARGELIAFLDADDVWLPQKLEHQVGILTRFPEVGMVCGPSLYWYSWARESRGVDRLVPVGASQDGISFPPKLLLDLHPLGTGAAPCPTAILVRREICARVGMFEEHFHGIFSLYEDQAFLIKLYLEIPVFISSLCCECYRQHPSSVTSQVLRSGRYDDVRLAFLNWLQGYLIERALDRGEAWDALQCALYRYRHPVKWLFFQLKSEPRRGVRRIRSYLMRKGLPRLAFCWVRRRFAASAGPKRREMSRDRQEAAAEQCPAAPAKGPAGSASDAGRSP